ncbi:hypothetical protein LTR44_009353 [Exophiala sp. CCFEE 6388]|nr:hypothetical protein LTR44_009353 [Eurotiomycetes sp. CCFEE 6388]
MGPDASNTAFMRHNHHPQDSQLSDHLIGFYETQALECDNSYTMDPFLMLFDDSSFHTLPHVQENFYEDFTAAYGYGSSDYDITLWNHSLDAANVDVDGSSAEDTVIVRGVEAEDHLDSLAPIPTSGQHSHVSVAYANLREYATTNQPTRPSSPESAKAHEQYLHELGQQSPIACDDLVINLFIGLFQTHVAPTFPCFKESVVHDSTAEEIRLAMAATGGLYCDTPRSETVAKWLLHIARRKLLTLFHSGAADSPTYRSRILQTYVLMEIFAFICGDKRLLLLQEVFHGQATQVSLVEAPLRRS